MRQIIVTEFYTLDGMMSDPKDQMDWVINNMTPDMGAYEEALYQYADTLLLGRVTYKIFESYWPKAETDPNTPKEEIPMARKINAMEKIVFSKSMKKTTWKNSRIMYDIDPAIITGMKNKMGKNLIIVGSASIVRQFADLNLVDEFHLLVHPIILSKGKPLFTGTNKRHELELINATTYQNGVVMLRYKQKPIISSSV